MKKSLMDKLYAAGMIQLEDPPGPSGGGAPTPSPTIFVQNPGGVQTPAGTFSQDDLNRIAATEHDKGERRGKQAAMEEAAKTLGVSIEEAAAIIKAHNDAEDKAKTEAQRAAEAAVKTKADADADRLAAKAELHAARVERALTAAGVDEKAMSAVNVPGITVESTVEEIKAAVEKFKTDVPSLFTGTVIVPKADPARPGQLLGTPPTGTLGAEGIKRFEQRYGEKAKA